MKQTSGLIAYNNQIARCRNKTDANGQSVEMRMTFEEWFSVWENSGRWDERGNKAGQYVMSRKNDLGHYELGNVFIQLHSENTSQRTRFGDNQISGFQDKQHTEATKQMLSEQNRGSGSSCAILDEDRVRTIKVMLASGTKHRVLADMFHVSLPTISAISTCRTWKHVTL